MLIYKSRDGNKITIVIGDREETMTIAAWSALIARPATRAK
jgi:hypothetical protein